MTQSIGTTNLDAALANAARGRPVLPVCWPTDDGQCGCGQDHKERDVGKAPVGRLVPNAINDATTDPTVIRRWWDECPSANVGIDLIRSGLLMIDPDSPEAVAEARAMGLLPTITRNSRSPGYLYQRTEDLPEENVIKQGLSEHLDVLARGYAVVHGRHQTGADVYLDDLPDSGARTRLGDPDDSSGQPGDDQAWEDGSLLERAGHRCGSTERGMERWRGDRVERGGDGRIDRSASLFLLGLALAEAGAAAATIVAALQERDASLAWSKYTERRDSEVRYDEIAQKAVEHAETPSIQLKGNGRATHLDGLSRPTQATPAWPEPPGPAAFSGLAGRIVEAITPFTEADPVAVLGQLLTAFGCAIGAGPHAQVGATRHSAKSYIALVGKSSKARKGDSWQPVRSLIAAADSSFSLRIQGGLSSGEGLIQEVRDPEERLEPIKEKGKVTGYQTMIVDQGELDKRLLIIEPELARVLRVMARQGSTLEAILRDAWDYGDLSIKTKRPVRATAPHIAMIGHVTLDELRRELTDVSIANGFANRIIWLLVRRSQDLPEPAPFEGAVVDELARELTATLQAAKTIGLMRRDERAAELWREIYGDLAADREGLAGSVLGRAEAHVLRLSQIYALLDRSPLVRLEHLVAAVELWAYAERSVEHIFGDATGDPVADAILTALRGNGELSRTQISELFGRHESAARISMALELLLARRRARVGSRETKGRPAEIWTPV